MHSILIRDMQPFFIQKKENRHLDLRAKIIQAEEERLNGAKTRSITEARKELREHAQKV